MRRTAAVAILLLISAAPNAEAAVWRWGCMGHTAIHSLDLTTKDGPS